MLTRDLFNEGLPMTPDWDVFLGSPYLLARNYTSKFKY